MATTQFFATEKTVTTAQTGIEIFTKDNANGLDSYIDEVVAIVDAHYKASRSGKSPIKEFTASPDVPPHTIARNIGTTAIRHLYTRDFLTIAMPITVSDDNIDKRDREKLTRFSRKTKGIGFIFIEGAAEAASNYSDRAKDLRQFICDLGMPVAELVE